MKTAVLTVALAASVLGACIDRSSPDDVVGPFTGETHRYVVDSFTLPSTGAEARALGDDLTGDQSVQNAAGQLIAMLASYGDVTTHAADMLAAGTIASSVEIVADDLSTDDAASVIYIGADGAPATLVGGTFINGSFRSNRTRKTDAPGAAELHLPVYQDADPSILPLAGVEIDLAPDGAGGFDAIIRGGVTGTTVLDEVARGMSEMVASSPYGHTGMLEIFDVAPKDHFVSIEEVKSNSLMKALCSPDTTVSTDDGDKAAVSAAIGVHLRACESGNCNLTQTFDRCFDRILDGDETNVDCGGSCRACP
ncbi:MAG TPA: hypothetical protein VGM90_34575 [Kofleriaceae bacterium]|jgi:hypothetical protein